MKTLIGIVTFGNLPFTQLTINSIRATTKRPFDFFVVVGKPDDSETAMWLEQQGIPYVRHIRNMGFPASINDIYDYAWTNHAVHGYPAAHRGFANAPYDAVIIAGNDIVPLCPPGKPNAIDALIECAETTDWEWICSSQFDVRSLVQRYPETAKYFKGDRFVFEDFSARPWEIHQDFREPYIEPHVIKDVRNLALFKRSVFEKIGYADANFWPNGYFEDNDYCTRGNNAGLKTCALHHSAYFHFWSRTIHQAAPDRPNGRFFDNNARYYELKWGGPFNGEAHKSPPEICLAPGITLPAGLKISDRRNEGRIINYWEEKGR